MIILYSKGCPKCYVLEKKLEKSGLEFEVKKDFNNQELIDLGFNFLPVLEVDGKKMGFNDAIDFVNSKIGD